MAQPISPCSKMPPRIPMENWTSVSLSREMAAAVPARIRMAYSTKMAQSQVRVALLLYLQGVRRTSNSRRRLGSCLGHLFVHAFLFKHRNDYDCFLDSLLRSRGFLAIGSTVLANNLVIVNNIRSGVQSIFFPPGLLTPLDLFSLLYSTLLMFVHYCGGRACSGAHGSEGLLMMMVVDPS